MTKPSGSATKLGNYSPRMNRKNSRKNYGTFDQVEHIWETVIRPELPNFRTMQTAWSDDATLPENSVWYANWKVPDREF